MRIFITIIIVLTILGLLEAKSVIPSTSFSVLGVLSSVAEFIKSLNIQSYYLILPSMTITIEGLLTLLLILFVVGYISERFKSLEQNNHILTKRLENLHKELKHINENNSGDAEVRSSSQNEMKEIADDIRGFLAKLAESVTINPTVPLRSKKIRRVAAEKIPDNFIDGEDESISESTEIEDDSKDFSESKIYESEKNVIEDDVTQEQDVIDDNMSNIDLARALIESGEKDKAKEIILKIIKTGSSEEAHEARLLNLQVI